MLINFDLETELMVKSSVNYPRDHFDIKPKHRVAVDW